MDWGISVGGRLRSISETSVFYGKTLSPYPLFTPHLSLCIFLSIISYARFCCLGCNTLIPIGRATISAICSPAEFVFFVANSISNGYTTSSRLPFAITRLNSSSRFRSSFSPRRSKIICVTFSNSPLSLKYLYNLSKQNCMAMLYGFFV